MIPLALFTATRWEFHALRRALPEHAIVRRPGRSWAQSQRGPTSVLVVQTGVGPGRAGEALVEALEAHQLAAVLSIGFGGALTRAQVGDLLIATDVIAQADEGAKPGSPVRCAPSLVDLAERVARESAWGALTGTLLSRSTVAVSADEKARLGASTSAIGVDMESGAIGAVAARHGIPFLAVRAVSDRVEEALPEAFNRILIPGCRVRAALDLILRPANWVALDRLRRQTRIARRRLTAFTAAFVDKMV